MGTPETRARPAISLSRAFRSRVGIPRPSASKMVGNYEVGGDDFASGDGAKVRDNTAAVLAALNERFKWGDLADIAIGMHGLHFHHDCARDHHACPGSKVTKLGMLARIKGCEAEFAFAPIAQTSPPIRVSTGAIREDDVTPPRIMSVDDIQAALRASSGANVESQLPPCPIDTNIIWTECYGTQTQPGGGIYVGEFRDGKQNGRGTVTFRTGANSSAKLEMTK
jgi:hypothetical protein